VLWPIDKEIHLENSQALSELTKGVKNLGASRAVIIPAKKIQVEDSLAALCKSPGCPNFGQSRTCPPSVPGPGIFREWQAAYDHALFFTIEVPVDTLMSSSRKSLYQLLHEIAAQTELKAGEFGFSRARSFAGGSCKSLFCSDKKECKGLIHPSLCRFPDKTRPSMSGFGINVAGLIKTAGWKKDKALAGEKTEDSDMAGIYGLTLVY